MPAKSARAQARDQAAPALGHPEEAVGEGELAGRAAAGRLLRGPVELVDDPSAAAEGADGLLLVTEWNEFRQPFVPEVAGGPA